MLSNELKPSLVRCLKELHLPTVRACYGQEADRARQESLTYEHYLAEVMEREREVRRQNRIQRLLRESKLPLEKSLEAFEMSRLSSMLAAQFNALLEGSFVDRSENVLAFGNPGSGKTHLLCAIAQELIHRQGRRLLFAPCSLLVQQLLVAKRDLKLPRLLKALSKYDVLMIDNIGYVEQNREEMEVLFILLAERYERGSLITSNLPFSKWSVSSRTP